MKSALKIKKRSNTGEYYYVQTDFEQISENCDVIHIHITCSVSLQSGIANYWPGMHNTGFF